MFSIEEIKTMEEIGNIPWTLDNSEIGISYPYYQIYDAESEESAEIARKKGQEKRKVEKKRESLWDLGKSFLNPPWKAESEKTRARSIWEFEEKIERMKNLEKRFILTPFKNNIERHNVRGILANIRRSLNILNLIGRFISADSPAAEAVIPFIQERVDEVADCERIWRENPSLETHEGSGREETIFIDS